MSSRPLLPNAQSRQVIRDEQSDCFQGADVLLVHRNIRLIGPMLPEETGEADTFPRQFYSVSEVFPEDNLPS